MAKGPDNSVLEPLRAIRGTLDQHGRTLEDIQLRLTGIEQHMAGFQISEVRQNNPLDQLRERVDRIERRLELTDGE